MIIVATICSYMLAWAVPIEIRNGMWRKWVQKGIWVGTTSLNATAYILLAGLVQAWHLVFAQEWRVFAAFSIIGTILEIGIATAILRRKNVKNLDDVANSKKDP